MPNRSSIPWRLKAGACLGSAMLSVALVAVFAAPHISAQQKPAVPSRFVQPEPIDFNDHAGWLLATLLSGATGTRSGYAFLMV